jgi:hypothetical protein
VPISLTVFKPQHIRGIQTRFRSSRERLAAIDQLRHDLVHKLRFHQTLRQADAKIEYLFSTSEFFHNLIARHYGVQIVRDDPAKGVIPTIDDYDNLVTELSGALERNRHEG